MSRKVITFLGKNPHKTIYEWQGKQYPGQVFAQALREFVPFDQMLVLVTADTEKQTWPVLEALQDRRIKPIHIDDGRSSEEMWAIFQTVIDCVNEGETVIFDITHGFRSLPFLTFLFTAYLKSAKNVTIEAVYYGALEMSKDGITPVLDLSEFIGMLDWLTATEQFIQTGNARFLSQLLNPKHANSGVSFEAESTLQNISQAARLCQPFTLMQEAGKLETALKTAETEIRGNARPFNVLREKIVGAFSQFGDDSDDTAQQLRIEFRLIEWYHEKGQLIQAVTLAREWLIDAVTFKLGEPLDFLLENRKPFEEAISGVALVGKQHPQERARKFTENDLNRFGLFLQDWEDLDTLKQLWTDLKNVRNPLDHAEHQRKKDRERTLEALQKLQDKMDKKVMPALRQLAAKWNLA